MNNLEIIKNADNSVKTFTLENINKVCKIVDIYDGDTCRAVFEHNGEINKWTIRMNGYDSPEIRPSRKLENRDEIKKKAIESKNYLKSIIMNESQLVYLKCGKFDKYGRLLGTILVNEHDTVSVNELMINNGYGYEYHGGTKK
jgi:endonuclease YncB( thermonuclease family)